MTHPSIQGLREAVADPRCIFDSDDGDWRSCSYAGRVHPECYEAAQAAYLTEHGVLLSGEGLVREVGQATCTTVYIGQQYDRWDLTIRPDAGVRRVVGLVPVPQDGA